MASKSRSRTLTDHEEIRRWAEERNATPAAVRNTERGDEVGIIRLDFPGYSGAGSLEEIDWDEWFEKFDENNLALIVQDETAGGQRSNFNKLVSRDSVESSSGARSGRSSGRRSSSSGSRASSRGSRTASSSSRSSSSGGSRAKKSGGRASRRSTEVRAAGKKHASRESEGSRRSGTEGRAKSHRSSRSSGRKAA